MLRPNHYIAASVTLQRPILKKHQTQQKQIHVIFQIQKTSVQQNFGTFIRL